MAGNWCCNQRTKMNQVWLTISLYLEFVQYGTPLGTEELRGTPIKTHFQISILDCDGQPNTQVFQNREKHNFTIYGPNKSWGQAKVITSADLVDPSRHLVVNDTVKIFCQLWISGKITKKVEFFQDSGPSKEQRTQVSKNKLVNDLRNALSQSIATDVTVSTGETTFKAHKAILSARSSVFAAMFDANMIERETATVQIVDFDDEVVKGMLEHLYTGETTVIDNRAQELLQIAEKYNLDGLKEDCEYAVGDKLSKGNAAEILALACTHNAPILKAQVIRFISKNKEELMKMKSFQDAVNAFAHTGVFVIC
ncbi:unnamed protein product [Orchesella dallaii]|uniref:BTB domain-containing protein n=1 Tax=Orchesella dallaii TaxID=48710 RepID=A0ABP1R020_9HEXA